MTEGDIRAWVTQVSDKLGLPLGDVQYLLQQTRDLVEETKRRLRREVSPKLEVRELLE